MAGLTSHPTRIAIFECLERDIATGTVAPGAKLQSERELAARFGVGRPLVREVLRGLGERGLIEVSPGRGAYARAARATDATLPLDALYRRQRVTPREVVEARLMVERDAAYLAADRATSLDIAAMRHALDAFDDSTDLLDQARWDVAFHVLLARASHNQVIETMFASITRLVFELALRSLSDPSVSRAGLPFHHDIVEAISERDAECARTAVQGHLAVAGRLYGNDLDSNLESLARKRLEHTFGASASLERALDLAEVQAAVDIASSRPEAAA